MTDQYLQPLYRPLNGETLKDSHPFGQVGFPQISTTRNFSGNGFFEGVITDSNNAFQTGATVQCWHRTSGVLVATTTTDSSGKYQFVNLPVGEMFDLIAIDPTGKWERKVSSSRYPKSGWYPSMSLRTWGRTSYNPSDTSAYLPLRAYGGNGTYAYSIDSSVNGLSCNATTGVITSTSLTAGTSVSFNASAADGAGNTVSIPISFHQYYDQYRAQVSSLLHFDGTNGSSTFIDDVITNVWTRNGTSTISTAQSKFGGASGNFPANTLSPISTPDKPNLQMGTSDFTIEGWFLPSISPNGFGICYAKGVNTPNGMSLGVQPTVITFRCNSLTSYTSSAVNITTWAHIAWVRASNVITIFLNGVSVFSQAITFNNIDTDVLYLGSNSVTIGNPSYSYSGYIDEFRITKGVARYTSNFTPPTSPFSLN